MCLSFKIFQGLQPFLSAVDYRAGTSGVSRLLSYVYWYSAVCKGYITPSFGFDPPRRSLPFVLVVPSQIRLYGLAGVFRRSRLPILFPLQFHSPVYYYGRFILGVCLARLVSILRWASVSYRTREGRVGIPVIPVVLSQAFWWMSGILALLKTYVFQPSAPRLFYTAVASVSSGFAITYFCLLLFVCVAYRRAGLLSHASGFVPEARCRDLSIATSL